MLREAAVGIKVAMWDTLRSAYDQNHGSGWTTPTLGFQFQHLAKRASKVANIADSKIESAAFNDCSVVRRTSLSTDLADLGGYCTRSTEKVVGDASDIIGL